MEAVSLLAFNVLKLLFSIEGGELCWRGVLTIGAFVSLYWCVKFVLILFDIATLGINIEQVLPCMGCERT